MNSIKIEVFGISIYKFVINCIRILLGSAILLFGLDLQNVIHYLFLQKGLPINGMLEKLFMSFYFPSKSLTLILALSLIIFSLIELVFIIAMLYRRKWGAIGIFALGIVWTLIEILFVSKFLLTSKILSMVINVIILYLLYKIITSHGYFKKQ